MRIIFAEDFEPIFLKKILKFTTSGLPGPGFVQREFVAERFVSLSRT
jgi:hypothetical protein